jgi:hypothetical protein
MNKLGSVIISRVIGLDIRLRGMTRGPSTVPMCQWTDGAIEDNFWTLEWVEMRSLIRAVGYRDWPAERTRRETWLWQYLERGVKFFELVWHSHARLHARRICSGVLPVRFFVYSYQGRCLSDISWRCKPEDSIVPQGGLRPRSTCSFEVPKHL